jgi:hypothetical protein
MIDLQQVEQTELPIVLDQGNTQGTIGKTELGKAHGETSGCGSGNCENVKKIAEWAKHRKRQQKHFVPPFLQGLFPGI